MAASSTAAPNIYGGDEVSAIVIDPGSSYTRIGFAGDDAPRAVVPSYYGVKENPDHDPELLPDANSPGGNEKYLYFFGENAINVPREGTEIKTPFKDGLVQDWEAFQKLCEYSFSQVLAIGTDLTEYPLLLTEQIWASDKDRELAMSIAFDSWNVPAFYIVKVPVCSTFACGKGSALVVDVGAELATVTPVLDGLALFKTSQRSKYAGNYFDKQIIQLYKKKGIEVNPWYLVAAKQPVETGAEASFTKRHFDFPINQSYHTFQISRVAKEFKEEISQIGESPIGKDLEATAKTFEFPDGSKFEFSTERYEVAESVFSPGDYPLESKDIEVTDEITGENTSDSEDTDMANDSGEKEKEQEITDALLYTDRTTTGFSGQGISKLIIESINACDVDIRPNLANNIVIVGGTTLTQGFTDRVNHDLSEALAGLKIRIYAPGNTIERKFASWIGGSILASLGTFHQFWISKKEYDEAGASKLLEKRFR